MTETTQSDIGAADAGHSVPINNGGSPEGADDNNNNPQYVGFWARVGAYVIDIILFFVPVLIPYVLAVGLFLPEEAIPEEGWGATDNAWGVTENILFIVYLTVVLALMFRWKGATPGKMIIGAKIVDEKTGERPSMKQCLIRALVYVCQMPTGGFLWLSVAFDKQKKGIHHSKQHNHKHDFKK